ncbi:MAG: CdaR family protein, partial [Clostridiales bacterium]|nr:CdaR family protein [Clostridiales bacterium]
HIRARLPASIEVELKETLTVTFPLFLDVLGEPAAGFKMMEALVSPAEVKLTGADDYIRRIARVYVAASIQDEEESYEKDLSVLVQDTTGNDISAMFTIDPRIARVVVPVMSEQPMRHLAVRVPFSGQTALGYQLSLISTTPSIVQVFGDLNRLQALDYVDTETVDISDWKTDTSLTAKLAPANGFTVYPREVTVALKIEPINSATVVKSIIIGQNIGEDCIAEVEQLTLTIMVYGPETFIASLDEADIVPYVDCEGLGGGEYELPVRVSLPANIILTNISQDTVFVTIIGPEKEDIDGDAPDTEAVDE